METKVGYNKNTKEAQDDSFSSPDTVCKYCNKDFKYFRRLKHHLRGHRSSEEKPFKCKQCEMGFSTKANCVRHIQNKHTQISHVNIENYVQVRTGVLKAFYIGLLLIITIKFIQRWCPVNLLVSCCDIGPWLYWSFYLGRSEGFWLAFRNYLHYNNSFSTMKIYNFQWSYDISCLVSWGCRILRLLLCSGVRPLPQRMSWIWQ